MSENDEVFVIVDNISKSFNGSQVLRDISTTINVGEVLGLIGRSGSGKSVLIHALRGTEEYRATTGKIIYRINHCKKCNRVALPAPGKPCDRCGGATTIEEVDFWGLGERDPVRMAVKERIAIMLQKSFALFGDISVIENIFEAFPEKMDEKRNIQRAIELLQMVNMTHRTTHIARDLSGGEKQRCVLARQLAKILYCSWPTSPTGTLDPQTAEMNKSPTEATKCQGMSMVVTSHWPKAISRLSDKAIWLESGEMVKRGLPSEVVKEFEVGYERPADMLVPVGEPMIKCQDARSTIIRSSGAS